MSASASLPIHLDARVRAPLTGAGVTATYPLAPQTKGLNVSRPIVPWRWSTAIVSAIELVGVVWSLPFVIIAIGAPVAFVMVALLWLVRSTLGAF
jgi:hypothetical protein